MVELYLSMKALDTIYYGFGGFLSKMLTKQKCLYLDLTSEELKKFEDDSSNNGDDENPICHLKMDGSMEIIAARSVCEKIRTGQYSTSDTGASPVFILSLDKNVPNEIRDKHGVLCIPDTDITLSSLAPLIESNTKYLITPKDRRRNPDNNKKTDGANDKKTEGANDEETVTWSSILKKSNRTCNAIVINDHYLFKNDGYNIYKHTPKSELKNLKEIMDSLLPLNQKEENVQILLLCEKKDLGNIGQRAASIEETISKIRPYPILFEIISGDQSCPLFKYTHNRQVATNYAIINVDHMLAAFDSDGKPTHDQPVRYMPLYSDGLMNDSDFPEKNHDLFLERVYNIVNRSQSDRYKDNVNQSGYEYFQNGKVMNINETKIANRLVSQFFGLRDGDNCSYLYVPNKSDWQGLEIKEGTYSKINYKNRIVVPSEEVNCLEKVMPQIINVFKDSPSVEGSNRNDDMKYYWVACSTASDIKTIHVLPASNGEKASNYYLFNCYQNEQDAKAVVNKVKEVLKSNNLW